MAEAKGGPGSPKRVRVRFKSVHDLRDAFVKDISLGGMFLRVPPEWPLRERIVVALELPDKSLLEINAEVVHLVTADKAKEPSKVGVGVSFIDLDATKRQTIETFLTDAIDGRSSTRAAADFETRPTREVSLQEIARRVQSRLERIEDVAALPELHSRTNLPIIGEGEIGVDFDPSAGHVTREVELVDSDVLRNLEDELTLVERGQAGGSAYDVLGVKPSSTQDEIQGLFRARSSALSDERLGALSPELEVRLARAREELAHAHAILTDPERRAALDVQLKIMRPTNRSQAELDAHRQEMLRRREQSLDYERTDWARAEPLANDARGALGAGDPASARRAIRNALLYDPYNPEHHDLLDQIEIMLDMEETD
jgi:Tfp pilus assembly protein PilZ